MNIIAWVVLGLVAGAIGKAVYPGHQGGGILATMFLGIAGSFIGGSLATLLSTGHLAITATSLSFSGIALAVVGAILAIYLWGMFAHKSSV